MASAQLTLAATICSTNGSMAADVHGEKVILQLSSGLYFGLSPIASRIWELVQTPISIDAVVDALAPMYAVDRGTLEGDVVELVMALLDSGLVERVGSVPPESNG